MTRATSNAKDVVVRISGKDNLSPVLASSERKLVTWRDRVGRANAAVLQGLGQGIGGRFGVGISAGLAGGFAGAGAFAAAAIGVELLGKGFEKLGTHLGIITDHFKEFRRTVEDTMGAAARAQAKFLADASKPGQSGAQSIRNLLGGTNPFFFRDPKAGPLMPGHERNIANLFRQLGRRPEGLFSAQERETVQKGFAGIDETQNQFIEKILNDNKSQVESLAKQLVESGMDKVAAIKKAKEQFSQQNRQILEASKEFDKERKKLEEQFLRSAIRRQAIGMFQGVGGQLGAQGRRLPGLLGSLLGQLGTAASPFAAAFGGLQDFRERNRQMRLATEAPHETLRRELDSLEAQRGQLTPEMYARRRQQLLIGGASMLQQRPFMPLSVTESRTLTRGQDQQPEDKITQAIQRLSQKNEMLLRELVEQGRKRGELEVVVR